MEKALLPSWNRFWTSVKNHLSTYAPYCYLVQKRGNTSRGSLCPEWSMWVTAPVVLNALATATPRDSSSDPQLHHLPKPGGGLPSARPGLGSKLNGSSGRDWTGRRQTLPPAAPGHVLLSISLTPPRQRRPRGTLYPFPFHGSCTSIMSISGD